MDEKQYVDIVGKILELKLIELRRELPKLTVYDLYNYLMNVVLVNKNLKDVNDASFYIMNIKVNRLYQYLNLQLSTNDTEDTIENDLKYILEG